ncbi:MAG TPA: cation-translocating P-type ATPase [Chloroflexota bacterium]|nr:cation-translocating P-type ATPase [Chloroflexota bacterium]
MTRLLRETVPGVTEAAPAAAAVDQPHEVRTTVLRLSGLWCASCGWLISERLHRTPGVVGVDVSVPRREAQVTYDPARTDARRCIAAVRRAGYRAWLPGEKAHDEEDSLFLKLLVGGLFVGHDMILSAMIYGRELLGWATPESEWIVRIFQWMMMLGALPVLALMGLPILRAGLAALRRGRPNLHTLITLGVGAAFTLSVYLLAQGGSRTYFDTASMLLYLVTLGHYLEVRAQKQGMDAVARLDARLPQTARWMTPEGERDVPPEDLPAGARVRVLAGETFPVDGLVVAGEGDVDESVLTGEPLPLARRVGDRVLAGTCSVDGSFEVVTLATGAATAAGQIGRLLHEALWQRSPVERLADRLAALMTPLACALAAGALAYWTWAAGWEAGLLNALSVLLIACPCALGLATPLTLTLAVTHAAAAGAVVRGAPVLERLADVRAAYFDKTGTLTRGTLTLQTVCTALGPVFERTVLAVAAAVEEGIDHPIATAIVAGARVRDVRPLVATERHTVPGKGVAARVAGATALVGSEALMAEAGISIRQPLRGVADEWGAGRRVVFVAWDGVLCGALGMGETLRPEVKSVLAELAALGAPASVLTGDSLAAGQRWQRVLDVPVLAGQLPEGKLERLRAHAGAAAPAALMVGDGVNDGPALAAAAVGIALRHGTDVSRAAADVVLLRDDLRLVPWLVRLARHTRRVVRQNLVWAFSYNVVGLGLALAGVLQPSLAALAMVASSAMVTGNALRLRRFPRLASLHTEDAL